MTRSGRWSQSDKPLYGPRVDYSTDYEQAKAPSTAGRGMDVRQHVLPRRGDLNSSHFSARGLSSFDRREETSLSPSLATSLGPGYGGYTARQRCKTAA